jgi:hypothetical protein
MPKASAHKVWWLCYHMLSEVYIYDPTDDGPETYIISYFKDFPEGHDSGLLSGIVETCS